MENLYLLIEIHHSMKGKMSNFHLINENNQYSIKVSRCILPDNTICTINLDVHLQENELNEVFLGVNGPAIFSCKEQAASRFFTSSDKIKKIARCRDSAMKKITIPRRMPYY